MVFGGVEMADELAAVPVMEGETGMVGDDHRAAVRLVGVDRIEVEGDLRGGRRADGEDRPGPAGDDRAVEMAGDHGDDVIAARDRVGQPLDPGGFRILGHPAEARLNRRMVENDGGRPIRRLVEPGTKPGGADLAEGAAMAARLERIENENPDRELVDRILDEAVGGRRVRKLGQEGRAAVMIAHRVEDREGKHVGRLAEAGI